MAARYLCLADYRDVTDISYKYFGIEIRYILQMYFDTGIQILKSISKILPCYVDIMILRSSGSKWEW